MQPDVEEQTATIIMPEDPTLIRIALRIQEESDTALQDLTNQDRETRSREAESTPPLTYYPVNAEAAEGASLYHGREVTAEQRQLAVSQLAELGYHHPTPIMIQLGAELLHRNQPEPMASISSSPTPLRTKTRRKGDLKAQIKRLAYRCSILEGVEVRQIYTEMARSQGVWSRGAEEDHLIGRVNYLEKRLKKVMDNGQ